MRVIREIDRGGFGIVHEVSTAGGGTLARKSFEPRVASAGERTKLAKRFAREVRIQSQIDHPNIMPIVEHDLSASPPWFTMPLASESLATKLRNDHSRGAFDVDPWPDILAAVEELHRLGYVHRDLKPENILRVGGKWVLSDFGLILPTARETTVLTGSKTALGSAFYAAPEQARDFRNTPEQADIFALGCILHDAVEPNPVRVPFAQIRTTGVYGPLLEKCTETEPTRRIASVAMLRAALFDLWRTSQFPAPGPGDVNLLDAVLSQPNSLDAWRKLVAHVESSDEETRDVVLRALTAQHLHALFGLDAVLHSRLMDQIAKWVIGTTFEWAYCDVVGDRLMEAYRVSPVRIRARVVLAALELSVSHNRWHVMNQVGAMLSPAADNGLIDRILIEAALDPIIEAGLRRIETAVNWARTKWHPKIAQYLSGRDAPEEG